MAARPDNSVHHHEYIYNRWGPPSSSCWLGVCRACKDMVFVKEKHMCTHCWADVVEPDVWMCKGCQKGSWNHHQQ
jgi:hypothetical protein